MPLGRIAGGACLLAAASMLTAASGEAPPLRPGLPWVQFHSPDFTRPAGSGVEGRIDLDTGTGIHDFSRLWVGLLEAPVTGELHFFAEADDGLELRLRGEPVIQGWGLEEARRGALAVRSGELLPLELRYFQSGGSAHLRLYWSWGSRPPELVPAAALWHRESDARRIADLAGGEDPAAAGTEDRSEIYRPAVRGGEAAAPLRLGPGPHLFVDDFLIAECSGVEREVNSPRRHLEGPVVSGRKGAGDGCFQPYLTVSRDPATGRFRIWYGIPESATQSHVATMESEDGIHWIRPHRVLADPSPIQFGVSVIDEGPGFPERSARFKLGYYGDGGLRVAASPDGLAWELIVPRTVLLHNHDINNIWFDPIRRRYQAMVSSYIPGSRWSGRRRVPMMSTSDDLVRWRRPWLAVTPDDGVDEGETQFYGVSGFLARGDLVIGMVKVLRDDLPADPGGPVQGIGYTTLAWSRDGERWTRAREVFFDRDPSPGTWDHAMAWIDCQLPIGDEVYLYYGGYARGHKVNRFEERQIGVARMTRDRYVARRAGENPGRLSTVPVEPPGESRWELVLNAGASRGQIGVELQDAGTGEALPGYRAGECDPVRGDGVALPVAWSGRRELPRHAFRIVFHLHRAALFGFALVPAGGASGATEGDPASGAAEGDPRPASGPRSPPAAGEAGEPLAVGDRKQLFIDRRFIARSHNVRIVMNPPVKAGVVLECDRPWEDFRLTSYFTVLQDADRCRMYYSCFSRDQWHTPGAWEHSAFLCYAESRDGIHWEKPALGIVDFGGSRDNNILLEGVVDGTVFLDPRAPPERWYKLLSTRGPHQGGLRVSYSPDGIHFTASEEAVSPWNPDSQQNAFWDERLGKYVAYLRGRPEMGIEVKHRLVVRVELDAIEERWNGPARVVLETDESDPPDVDFYTNACVRYPWAQDAYLMFPAAYHHYPPEMGNDGLLDTSLAVSRDGIRWERPDRRPYVPLGLRGDWDALFVMMGVGLVRQGSRVYQYYSGVDLSHGGTRRMAPEERARWRRWGKVGRVAQRLDGFCSADAGYEGGWLETPPIVFQGRRLVFNIDTSAAGHARVALADPAGEALAGFSPSDCDEIMTSDVAHVVTWRGSSDVSALAGRPVRLRVEMRSAKLYAFQFEP